MYRLTVLSVNNSVALKHRKQIQTSFQQEAQLSPRDRAMRRVN